MARMNDVIPFAVQSEYKMPTRGTYKKGWPVGAVVHYTAGRDGAEKTIRGGVKRGLTYLCIQKDGTLFQAHPVSRWGYHAGKSGWRGLFGGMSDDLIGIEINCAGRLKKGPDGLYRAHWGGVIPEENVRYSPGVANQKKGFYEVYTPEQEDTLVKTLLWLKAEAPCIFDFENVLGHDEVSGPLGIGYWRKTDPGASLSMTMPELRTRLIAAPQTEAA